MAEAEAVAIAAQDQLEQQEQELVVVAEIAETERRRAAHAETSLQQESAALVHVRRQHSFAVDSARHTHDMERLQAEQVCVCLNSCRVCAFVFVACQSVLCATGMPVPLLVSTVSFISCVRTFVVACVALKTRNSHILCTWSVHSR